MNDIKRAFIRTVCIILAVFDITLIADMVFQLAGAEKYDSFYNYTCPLGTKEVVAKIQRPVNADRLNCRSYPSTEAIINTQYDQGEWVWVIAVYEDWALVGVNETRPTGWVYAKYIGYNAMSVYQGDMVTEWY